MGYDLFSKIASNTLTNFIIEIDLSNCSTQFKAEWNTNDNGRGRAYKSDGTELPCDWVNLDYNSGTGRVYIRFTGTYSSVTSNNIYLYPPIATNTQYSRTDTYGQNNVWQDSICVFLLDGDTTERSGKGYDLTNSGAVSQNPGYLFDDAGDYIDEQGSKISPTVFQSGFTYLFRIKAEGYGENNAGRIVNKYTGAGGYFYNYLYADTAYNLRFDLNGNIITSQNNFWAVSTWVNGAIRVESNGDTVIYKNGSSNTSSTLTTPSVITDVGELTIGNGGGSHIRTFDGIIDRIIFLPTTTGTPGWISEDNDQVEDNSVYWGTPQWVSGSNNGKLHVGIGISCC